MDLHFPEAIKLTIMSHYCYCFDVLWKKKAKHMLLNALLQKAREHLATQF